MQRVRLCFECNYWADAMESVRRNPERALVANGRFYVIADESAPKPHGFNGRKMIFRLYDETVIESTNVWNGSQVPPGFRGEMPDTATIIGLD
jgi:hypothetical protein